MIIKSEQDLIHNYLKNEKIWLTFAEKYFFRQFLLNVGQEEFFPNL